MPVMRPPSGAKNVRYGCVYVDGSVMVADDDVACLTAEGWEPVYIEEEHGEEDAEEQE